MTEQLTETYYRIRFPKNKGQWNEYYQSNNGTSRWNDTKAVKGLIKRGQPTGYHGHILEPFTNYEIVKVTDVISRNIEPIQL